MGKRELLIALAFAVTGVIAWRMTASPPPDGTRPISIDTLAEIWQNRKTGGEAGHAAVRSQGTIAAPDALTELRLANLAAVDVRGEVRDDIAWTFIVEATGTTDEAARAVASQTTLRHDDLGGVLSVSARSEGEAPRMGTLTLVVPSRLIVRVESSRRTRIAGVAGVRLENLVGDTELREIAGDIEGSHRNGSLTIDGAGGIALALEQTTAVVGRPRGAVELHGRNGSTRIEAPAGAVTADVTAQPLTIVDPAGPVRAGGVRGEITIERPRGPVDIDGRRTRVALVLDHAVPVTVFVTDGSARLAIADLSRVALDIESDIRASGAGLDAIDASAVGLVPSERDGRSVIAHGPDHATRVAVRGDRSSIVIVPMK